MPNNHTKRKLHPSFKGINSIYFILSHDSEKVVIRYLDYVNANPISGHTAIIAHYF